MFKKLLPYFLFLSTFFSFSQNSPISEKAVVSILTVGVAEEAHSLYGHTALRIKDTQSGIDLVYNYGMFDFRTENFVLKFVKGDLQYYAAAYPYEDFEYSYKIDNRSIYEQVLDISLPEKRALFEKLNASLYSKERFYTYKFIDRNCTTKVIDIVNSVLVDKPIIKKNIDSRSYRDVLYPYAEGHFYQKLGINIIFGEKVDWQETQIFLPLDLLDNLKKTSYNGKSLALETKTLFEASSKPKEFQFLDSIYSLISILLIFVVINKKTTTIIYLSFTGIVGLLFSIVSFYSFHKEVLWNYNILLFNPLYLVLVYFVIRNNQKWIQKTSLLCLICIVIYSIYMQNKIHFYIVMPFIITTGILLFRIFFKKTIAHDKTK